MLGFIIFLILVYIIVRVIGRAWKMSGRKYKSFELFSDHGNDKRGVTDELIKLSQLLKEGAISQEEFNKQKAKLLK